jgi:hypothetical protein
MQSLPPAHETLSEEAIARKQAWMGGGEPNKEWFKSRKAPAYLESGEIKTLSGSGVFVPPIVEPASAASSVQAALLVAAEETGVQARVLTKRQRDDLNIVALKGILSNIKSKYVESLFMEHVYQFRHMPTGSAGEKRMKPYWQKGHGTNQAPPPEIPAPPRPPSDLETRLGGGDGGGPAQTPPCTLTQYLCSAKNASTSASGTARGAFLISCNCEAPGPDCPKKKWKHERALQQHGHGMHQQRVSSAKCVGALWYVEGSGCSKCGEKQEGLGAEGENQLQLSMRSSLKGSTGSSKQPSPPTPPFAFFVSPPQAASRVPEHSALEHLGGVIEARTGAGMAALLPLPHDDERTAGISIAPSGGIAGATSYESSELGHFVGCLEFIVAALKASRELVERRSGEEDCKAVYSLMSTTARCLVGPAGLPDVIFREIANFVDISAGERPGRSAADVANRRLGGALKALAKAKRELGREEWRRVAGQAALSAALTENSQRGCSLDYVILSLREGRPVALVDSGSGHSDRAWAEQAVVHDALRLFRRSSPALTASGRSKRRRVDSKAPTSGLQLTPALGLSLQTDVVIARAGGMIYRILPA